MQIATIVGARPQFIKAAVISRELRRRRQAGQSALASEVLIHTGQHFDANMSDVFFEQMSIPRPDFHLGIGGGPHGQMTGRMVEAIEGILLELKPVWVVVYGDTNSTLAGALAAVKLHIPVAHVEAGLRSFNRRMPEEVNRVLTDHAASLLFAPTDIAVANLRNEGIDDRLIARVGDVMYDAMIVYRQKAQAESRVLTELGLKPKQFILATVHRAENTDDLERLTGIMNGLASLAALMPVVAPIHPRTRKALDDAPALQDITSRLRLIEPVGYLDMVQLEANAALIATDSGGVQKEAYFNLVPCITLRDETEWLELVEVGANTLVGADPKRIEKAGREALGSTVSDIQLYGDGHAGADIIDRLLAAGQTVQTP